MGIKCFRLIMSLILSVIVTPLFAETLANPLPAEKAFILTATFQSPKTLLFTWQIAPGYYLYKNNIKVRAAKQNQVAFTVQKLPGGIKKHNDILGNYTVFSNQLTLPVLIDTDSSRIDSLAIQVSYQGCSTQGFCYSPITKELEVMHLKRGVGAASEDLTPYLMRTGKAKSSNTDNGEAVLNGHSVFMTLLTFLGLGILLAFTPCVLPMVPILSGIIMGQRHHLTTKKSFFLSMSYVLGMATMYAIAGIVIALMGSHLQAEVQKPWVIILFSSLFILLAFSLFGFFQLKLPGRWQGWIYSWSDKQKAGTYIGVFAMGALSSLVVSPCVSAPLVGVLAYIARTGNVLMGGGALFALGIGMGVPLLLIGTSAGKFLPKAGDWMHTLERMMGLMLLAFAVWMLGRILPGPLVLFLWSLQLVLFAVFLGLFSKAVSHWQKFRRGIGLVGLIYGAILMLGAALGNTDPFHPLENIEFTKKDAKEFGGLEKPLFQEIHSMQELDAQLLRAKQESKNVLIDFYADWCTSCIRMDREVFKNKTVLSALSSFILLRANVTENTMFDQLFMQRFNVIAPPTVLFFNGTGDELSAQRIIGEVSANEFKARISLIEGK